MISVEPLLPGAVVEATLPELVGWKARVRVEPFEGTYVITACEVLPHDPDHVPRGGLRTAALRQVPLMAIMRQAFTVDDLGTQTDDTPTVGRTVADLIDIFDGAGTARAISDGTRRGRVALDDKFYAQVALDWERLTAEGSTAEGSPRARLAAKRGQSPTTVRNWVHEATLRGLLDQSKTPGPRPRRATTKARRLVQGDEPS